MNASTGSVTGPKLREGPASSSIDSSGATVPIHLYAESYSAANAAPAAGRPRSVARASGRGVTDIARLLQGVRPAPERTVRRPEIAAVVSRDRLSEGTSHIRVDGVELPKPVRHVGAFLITHRGHWCHRRAPGSVWVSAAVANVIGGVGEGSRGLRVTGGAAAHDATIMAMTSEAAARPHRSRASVSALARDICPFPSGCAYVRRSLTGRAASNIGMRARLT